MRTRNHYEDPDNEFEHDAYKVAGWGDGIAFSVLGWETESDEETEWTGIEERTGNVIVRMIGDDRLFSVDPDDVEPIPDDSFCRDCGQIRCGHNVYS